LLHGAVFVGTCRQQLRLQERTGSSLRSVGSPIAETNSSGAVTARFRYEPYGQSLEASVAQGPSYTGHVYDQSSGLIYMQQRYYDPMIGRFLSTDPAAVDGMGFNFNRYAYAANNPYKYVDPDGRVTRVIFNLNGGGSSDSSNGGASSSSINNGHPTLVSQIISPAKSWAYC
jgi:RHS repeat-associated protein